MNRSLRAIASVALIAAMLATPTTAVNAAPPDLGPRPLGLPWSFAADLEGVEAATSHAAGLAFMPAFEMAFVGNIALSEPQLLGNGAPALANTNRVAVPSSFGGLIGARLGSLAVGVGVSGLKSDDGLTARFDFGMAWRFGKVASIGVQWQLLTDRDDPTIDAYKAFTLSTTLRPFRALSAFASIGHLNAPDTLGFPVDGGAPRDGPILRLGLGLRPFGEVGSIGLEAARHMGTAAFWQAGINTRWWLMPGFALGAYARYTAPDDGTSDPRIDAGFHLALSQGGMALESSVDIGDVDGTAITSTSILMRTRAERLPSLVSPDNIVVRVAINGPLPERPNVDLFGRSGPGFAHWLVTLDAIGRDPDVSAVFLQINGAPGWAQCWELRAAVARLKGQGKKVFAGLVIADMRAMFLASAADEVWLFASGGMTLTGLSLTQSYYFELLKKIGVAAEFIAFEEYKSFPEVATRTGPTDPAREQTRRILDLIQGAWSEAVATGRKIAPEALDTVLQTGPQSMHDARSANLVDALVEADAYSELLRERLGNFTLVSQYTPWPKASKRWGTRGQIAIVPVVGSIVDGESSGSLPLPIPFIGGTTTGDRSFIQALEAAVHDSSVAGVVVRVDSGGGSVTASDRMHRAIKSLSKHKPIVISFGGAAASGGYYLAAGADTIFSTPLTVTGSIGIFTGKADLSELYRLIGITHHTEKTHERADMLADHRAFTEAEKVRARHVLKAYYDRFLGLVSEGRGLDLPTVQGLAKGRVWLGSDALTRGLVDVEGGLLEAMQHVAHKAGRDLNDLDVRYYGSLGAFSGLQRLVAQVLDFPMPSSESQTNPELAAIGQALTAMTQLDIGAPLAIMPFTLSID